MLNYLIIHLFTNIKKNAVDIYILLAGVPGIVRVNILKPSKFFSKLHAWGCRDYESENVTRPH